MGFIIIVIDWLCDGHDYLIPMIILIIVVAADDTDLFIHDYNWWWFWVMIDWFMNK